MKHKMNGKTSRKGARTRTNARQQKDVVGETDMKRCVCVRAFTLDDVGHHESCAGVVADEATARQIMLYLECKQIPGEKKERKKERKKETI